MGQAGEHYQSSAWEATVWGTLYLVARMRCTIIKVDLSTYMRLH